MLTPWMLISFGLAAAFVIAFLVCLATNHNGLAIMFAIFFIAVPPQMLMAEAGIGKHFPEMSKNLIVYDESEEAQTQRECIIERSQEIKDKMGSDDLTIIDTLVG